MAMINKRTPSMSINFIRVHFRFGVTLAEPNFNRCEREIPSEARNRIKFNSITQWEALNCGGIAQREAIFHIRPQSRNLFSIRVLLDRQNPTKLFFKCIKKYSNLNLTKFS